MGAFDKVQSGLPDMDKLLDNIRLGDNVVLQVSNIEEFRFFTKPFIAQAIKDKRKVIYFRFATHEPLVEEKDAHRYSLDPGGGFENFTISVHRIIEQEGREAFYVFDCLSELQVAWAADLMMGNFFCVTCPFLFKLDTVALFPLIRGGHSFDTIARIRETTQLFLDVYSDENNIYLHPIKVWNRYSAFMFLPHKADKQEKEFRSLTDSVSVTLFYRIVEQSLSNTDQNLDSWERYFRACSELKNSEGTEDIQNNLCRMMMTKDNKIRAMLADYFGINDYLQVKKRMIGSGKIGGKACGMLLSRNIVEKELPHLSERLEPHDSYYIGDHIFYTYMVFNNLWELHIKQKDESGYYEVAERLDRKIRNGVFPENIRAQLRRMLEYYGQAPIIVRSSSMLEDSFGNAFAGKYESVFCGNQGTLEERLEKLERAIRIVYASIINPSALEYRRKRGLDQLEEQMSILVQRVSGSIYGEFFFPSIGGVGYSQDLYSIDKKTEGKKGMLRMVFGLGTRAVDRTENDYPRIVHLDKPSHTYITSMDDKVKFSQRKMDVISIGQNKIAEITVDQMMECTPYWYQRLVLEHDYELERRLREQGNNRQICFGTCQGYVQNEQLLSDMDEILSTLHRVYTYPVDIEYTVNSNENKQYVICLLQCRPLQTFSSMENIEIPQMDENKILFTNSNSSLGATQLKKIDAIAVVDAKKYYEYPYNKKMEVANLITSINSFYKNTKSNVMIMVPGRIGTSSPELGIPVKFSGISSFCAIAEMDYTESGYAPELSYGSHIFQDLVETGIFYTAINNVTEEVINNNKKLLEDYGIKGELPEGYEQLSDMVSIYKFEEAPLMLYYDIKSGITSCGIFEQ
ncbi:PEP/pyruvate-binding domain-containing protein [Konateibacter massiliensis]|uniref:PEP/pyruvate-binding domain-containing protein n=1 Tax=Konateibacter massiliensis TaxID=2002841 RepID=UPI000C145E95|nr:PEP/pyruvate-binding domain-containing protein [Konateibacter massiliensis]